MLLGDILARDNLGISHMLVKGFLEERIVNLNLSFARGEGDQLTGLLFKIGVADDQVAGHGKLN